MKELGQRHQLTLAAFGDPHADLSALSRFVQDLHVLPMPRWRQWLNVFSRAFFSSPANINAYASDAMRAKVDSLLASEKFDAVFCYRLRMAPYALRSRLPRILDYTDSLTRYFERRAAGASGLKKTLFRREAQKIGAYESWTAAQFEAGFMNSGPDTACLRAMAPHARILTASNGADFTQLKPLKAKRDPRRMIFIGNLAYAPNAQAVLWFHRECCP